MIAYAHIFPTPLGDMVAAVNESEALLRLDFLTRPVEGLCQDLHSRGFDIVWENHCAHVIAQVEEYFQQKRRAFDLALALAGTDFQKQVWAELQRIPYGETISYGELARRIGRPTASRAVGQANGANPVILVIPCHRVIGANRSLTGFASGIPIKERLLALEKAQLGLLDIGFSKS